MFFGLALLDSINPSALLASGYILQRPGEQSKARSIVAYVSGIFCFYFIAGLLLLAGLSAIVDSLGGALESRPAYIVQAIIGVALFAWSWIPPKSPEQSRLHPTSLRPAVLFSLGIMVTLVEFATALPYFGAITLLQQATTIPTVGKVGLLAIYNLIFVLPPIATLILYSKNRQRFEAWQARRVEKRENGKPNDTMQWVAGAAGVILFLNALPHIN